MSDITERLEALLAAIRLTTSEEQEQSYDLDLTECYLLRDGVAELNTTIARLEGEACPHCGLRMTVSIDTREYLCEACQLSGVVTRQAECISEQAQKIEDQAASIERLNEIINPTWHPRSETPPYLGPKAKLWASDGEDVWAIWATTKFSNHAVKVKWWAIHSWPDPPAPLKGGDQ